MNGKPDLTIKQVETPPSRWCCSGHFAPETFKLYGNDGPEAPTRFFYITGHGINGIYCEPCLCIANYISQQKKAGK